MEFVESYIVEYHPPDDKRRAQPDGEPYNIYQGEYLVIVNIAPINYSVRKLFTGFTSDALIL